MNTNLTIKDEACSAKLPYVCQVDEGQCWFGPIEDATILRTVHSVKNLVLSECAKECRDFSGVTDECWGFTMGVAGCTLFSSAQRHGYFLHADTELVSRPDETAYLKVCTGGEVTSMAPVIRDDTLDPDIQECSADSANAVSDDGVCYCECDEPPVILQPEYLALPLDEKVEKIVKELKVDVANTSARHRKHNSADDQRPSAKSLGALGISILTIIFGSLILLDLSSLITHISFAMHNRVCGVEGILEDSDC